MRENKKMPVKVSGVAEVLTAMRKFEPDLAANLNKQMRAGMTPIQKKARGYVPSNVMGLRNWMAISKGNKITKSTSAFAAVGHFPKFNPSIVRKGIKINTGATKKNKYGFVILYSISNYSRAGAIMETAGRTNPGGNPRSKSNNPHAGEHFINAQPGLMVGSGQARGRLLYRASHEDQGRTTAVLTAALQRTITQFHDRAAARSTFRNAA